jgi:hypothetical protein
MFSRLLSLHILFFGATAIHKELTDSNFEKEIDGKNAILWFLAPW